MSIGVGALDAHYFQGNRYEFISVLGIVFTFFVAHSSCAW